MAIRRPFGTSDDNTITTTTLQKYQAATADATTRVVSAMFNTLSIPTATKAQTINIEADEDLQVGAVVLISAQTAGSTLKLGTATRQFAGKKNYINAATDGVGTGAYEGCLMYDGTNFRWVGCFAPYTT